MCGQVQCGEPLKVPPFDKIRVPRSLRKDHVVGDCPFQAAIMCARVVMTLAHQHIVRSDEYTLHPQKFRPPTTQWAGRSHLGFVSREHGQRSDEPWQPILPQFISPSSRKNKRMDRGHLSIL